VAGGHVVGLRLDDDLADVALFLAALLVLLAAGPALRLFLAFRDLLALATALFLAGVRGDRRVLG
jgi:hypothetical protein